MNIMQTTAVKSARFQIRAFTLLESLLVLFITGLVISLFSFSVGKTIKIVQGELFLVQFENAYKDAQYRASCQGEEFTFSCQNQRLYLGNLEDNSEIQVPSEAKVDDFSLTFDKYGNNSSLQKLIINLPYESRRVSYQLEMGSGKYKKTIEEK